MTIPFVYIIGWKKLDKWYIGSKSCKECVPTDLWTKYFTSSKYVAKFRQENGEPDSFEILKEFNKPEDAIAFEIQKQIELDVLNDDRWLNRNINGEKFRCTGHSEKTKEKIRLKTLGKKHPEETKLKMSLSSKGKKKPPRSEEHKRNMSKAFLGKNNPNFGKTQSEETIAKRAQKLKGQKRSEEAKRKMSIAHLGLIPGNKGVPHSEEAKKKMSIAHTGKILSEEHKRKIGEAGKGRQFSEETRKKMSEKAKSRKYKPLSQEHKRKLSESMKRYRNHGK